MDLSASFGNHEILLTGANGFLGKIILAMLLDRFPEAKRVHALIRPRPGQTAAQRFEREVLGSPSFAPLARKLGKDALARRVRILSGDASQPGAGIGARPARELKGRVKLVLNCAGLVDFFPPVDRSIQANVESVERLLELCGDLGASLLHVSTCYVAGAHDGLVEETEPVRGFYPRRAGTGDSTFRASEELRSCRAAMAETGAGLPAAQRAKALTELGRARAARWGWVNTYTYAKSLGEQLIAAQQSVPYAIVRPAIVESALRFPFPGWIEGGRTAAPLALMALGGLLDWPARPDLSLEVVPVDLVAAATLAVGGELLAGRAATVYHLAGSDRNPYPLADLIRLLCEEARTNGRRPAPLPCWLDPLPRLKFLSSEEAARRRRRHRRRAAAARRLFERAGWRGPADRLRLLQLQLRFHEETFRQYLPFILENRYLFEAVNIRRTYARLSPGDRERLPWDPESIRWPDYWRRCQIPGMRKWIQPQAVREWAFQI